jgi:phage terminase large subunit
MGSLAETRVQIPKAFQFLYSGSARIRAAYGGRGSGKSHAFAQALILKAAQSPKRILCAREIQLSIKESVKKLLDDKIEALGLNGSFTSTDTEIRGANGSHFLFAGLRTDPQKIKSMEGIDICWVEEASTVSQTSLDLLLPTIRQPGSEIWMTWNPGRPTDPVDVMLRADDLPANWRVKRVNWYDNPWFPAVLRDDMDRDRRRDKDKYAHVWLGGYKRRSAANVFSNWTVETFKTPPDMRFYYGADWGFSVDPTVLIRCFLVGRTLYVDHEVHKVGCEIEDTPALFDHVPGSRDWQVRADSARPETISYMQRNGFPKLVPATKGPGSVEDGIEFLKSCDIVVHPDCVHTIDELSLYSYKTDKLTDEVLPVLEDKKNHVIDALRYALENARPHGHQFAFA